LAKINDSSASESGEFLASTGIECSIINKSWLSTSRRLAAQNSKLRRYLLMDTEETERFEAFRRVRDLGVEHASDFPAASLGSTLFAELGVVVTQIESLASTQESRVSSSRQGTQSRFFAREELLEEMEAIAQTARGIALDSPGLEHKFRPSRSLSATDLLTLARAFHADATPLAAEFIRHGLAADFLDDLGEAITAFEQEVTDRDLKRESQVSTTAAIGPLIAEGMKLLKHLNVVVRNIYRNNPAMLAAWTSASHITRRTRKSRAPQQPSPPAGQPPTA
jgi:hypothetical protein